MTRTINTRKRLATAGTVLTTIALAGGLLVACSDNKHESDSQTQGQADTEQAFKQQSKAVPYPVDQLKDSQERRNLKERLLRQNDPNHISYVYILSFAKPLGYYVIKGKVSSTQSQMTTDQLQVDACNRAGEDCPNAIDAPGDDGSYGPNEDGIFFFTTQNVMVQTSMDYVVSDQPIPFGELKLPKLG